MNRPLSAHAQPSQRFLSLFRRRGFTLLEVLVALALLALALMATLKAGTAMTSQAEALRLRQLADWVASDLLAEQRARQAWLDVGRHGGEVLEAGERFVWEATVTSTPNAQFRRMEIRVRQAEPANPDDTTTLARLTGFLLRPNRT